MEKLGRKQVMRNDIDFVLAKVEAIGTGCRKMSGLE